MGNVKSSLDFLWIAEVSCGILASFFGKFRLINTGVLHLSMHVVYDLKIHFKEA